MIKQFPNPSRGEWLALRRHDVCGSEIGALFGLHRYLTPAQLYAEKIGALGDGDTTDGVKTRGVRLESFVADQVCTLNSNWNVGKNMEYYRDDKHRLGGTPDYFIIEGNERRFGVLEIKTVGMRDFIDIWRGGDPAGEIIPEPWQMLQVEQYMHLTGASFGKIAVLPVSEWSPMDVHIVDIPRRDDIIEKIIARADRFWEDVKQGIPPEFDYGKDMAVIKAMFFTATPGKAIDLRGDAEFVDLLELREQYKQEIRDNETLLTDIDARIRARLGDCESAVSDGWTATLKNQHRAAYSVEAADFRVLRTKRSK